MEREARIWYSGVKIDKHASSGVGCMVRKELENVEKELRFTSDRVMYIRCIWYKR